MTQFATYHGRAMIVVVNVYLCLYRIVSFQEHGKRTREALLNLPDTLRRFGVTHFQTRLSVSPIFPRLKHFVFTSSEEGTRLPMTSHRHRCAHRRSRLPGAPKDFLRTSKKADVTLVTVQTDSYTWQT